MSLLPSPLEIDIDHSIGSDEKYSIYFTTHPPMAIASVSKSNPTIVTTKNDHCLRTGEKVAIVFTDSCPALQDLQEFWTITVLTPTTFSVPANVDLHAGTQGIVWGALKDLTGYIFDGGLYNSNFSTTLKKRYLDAVADTTAGKSFFRLKTNKLEELSFSGKVTIEAAGIFDATVERDEKESCFSIFEEDKCCNFVSGGENIYFNDELLTCDKIATATVQNAMVFVTWEDQKQLNSFSKVTNPIITSDLAYGKITVKFPENILPLGIQLRHRVTAIDSASGDKTLIVEGVYK